MIAWYLKEAGSVPECQFAVSIGHGGSGGIRQSREDGERESGFGESCPVYEAIAVELQPPATH